MITESKNLIKISREKLSALWQDVLTKKETKDILKDKALTNAISNSINSKTKTYRYVLPTQILAKLIDSTLDCRCLQVIRGGQGSFDARSLCHKVIVPFDKDNDYVLGGSLEPYVNNPLRQPEISSKFRKAQKDKEGWDNLCKVVDAVESTDDKAFTHQIYMQILIEIYKRLSEVKVTYPAPKRISLEKTISIIEKFLSEQSGGDRLQAISSALFLTIGKRFSLFSEVRRENINAADASSGQVADLECLAETGEIILAVEVKDRNITVSQIKNKLPNMRAQKVTEILFIAQQGIAKDDVTEANKLIEKEFASGQNIYIFDLNNFCLSILAIFGETGRREFLDFVGKELDSYRSEINHRRAWANLLSEL